MILSEGERVFGRFRIERTLSAREGSETYLAADEASGARAVVRALRLRGAARKAVELFEREAQVLAALSHPGIPRLLAHGHEERQGDVVFLLGKEYVPGETLAERVAREPLDVRGAAAIAAAIAEVLAAVHGRIPPVVHRDVKPSNVVLREDGGVSLIDFGAVTDPGRFAEGGSTIVGTFGYIAPEQVVGDAGPAADLYALGATLLFALTGRDPASLPREGLRVAVAQVLPEGPMARLIAQLLEPDPRQRPPSAEAVRARLVALAGAPPVAPDAPGPEDARARWHAVRAAWGDDAVHDGFIAWCAERELLPFAGQCYRGVLEKDPENPEALRARGRILAQAQALLAVASQSRLDWKRISTVARAATLIVLTGALIFGIYLILTWNR